MRNAAMIVCLIACLGTATAATTAKKVAPKTVKPPSTAARPTSAAAKPLPTELLTCRTGPNDRQARLAVLMVKGIPQEFAYYSRLGTKVCSIYGKRGDFHTKWQDLAGKALVKLLVGSGNAELEYQPGHLKLTFSDVGRMAYCGMYGELNGEVEVLRKHSECTLQGIFD
jgi:hypothetical protein